MKSIALTVTILALAASLSAAPWRIEWSHLSASDKTESKPVLLMSSAHQIIAVGTTYGRVTDPTDEPPDVFRTVLNGQGKVLRMEQFGAAGGQELRGAARTCWGNETLVQVDSAVPSCEFINRSASGKPTNGASDVLLLRCHRDDTVRAPGPKTQAQSPGIAQA